MVTQKTFIEKTLQWFEFWNQGMCSDEEIVRYLSTLTEKEVQTEEVKPVVDTVLDHVCASYRLPIQEVRA